MKGGRSGGESLRSSLPGQQELCRKTAVEESQLARHREPLCLPGLSDGLKLPRKQVALCCTLGRF